MTLDDARRRKEQALARAAEIDLAERTGSLIPADELGDVLARVAAVAVSHLRPIARHGARAARAAASDAAAEQAIEVLVTGVRNAIADELESCADEPSNE